MPRNKETQKSFTVTLENEIYTKFESYCKKNRRSKNAQVTFLIEQVLKEEEKQ